MPYTAPLTVSAGQIYTPTMYNTYLLGNADSGFMRKLADSTLGGTAASIDFSAIPATFAHLMLVVYGRTDVAGTGGNEIGIRFNGDSVGTHYAQQTLAGSGATAAASSSLGQSFAPVGLATTAGHAAGAFGSAVAIIPNYTNSGNEKAVDANGGYADGAVASLLRKYLGMWLSSAAINQVTVIPSAGGNFVIGSRATLYGLPA